MIVGGLIVPLYILFVLVSAYLPFSFESPSSPLTGRSSANLKCILAGMQSYIAVHGSLPVGNADWHLAMMTAERGPFVQPVVMQHPWVPPDQPAYYYSPTWSHGVVLFENPVLRSKVGGGGLVMHANGVLEFFPAGKYEQLIESIPDAVPCHPAKRREPSPAH